MINETNNDNMKPINTMYVNTNGMDLIYSSLDPTRIPAYEPNNISGYFLDQELKQRNHKPCFAFGCEKDIKSAVEYKWVYQKVGHRFCAYFLSKGNLLGVVLNYINGFPDEKSRSVWFKGSKKLKKEFERDLRIRYKERMLEELAQRKSKLEAKIK